MCFYSSPKHPRWTRILCVGTQVISVLFVDTVLFALAYPDPHVCELRGSANACLVGTSPFDSKTSLCYWNSDYGECHLIEPKDSSILMVYLAIISIICGSPTTCLCCWLLTHVIGAPLKRTSGIGLGRLAQVAPIQDVDASRNEGIVYPMVIFFNT